MAEVALLSLEATGAFTPGANQPETTGRSDAGAARILLEAKYLFDVIDEEEDFAKYRVIILPDGVRIGDQLKGKLEAFFAAGGKVLATGESGLNHVGDAFAIDLGVR